MDDFKNALEELAESEAEYSLEYQNLANIFWHSLSEEDKLFAFYSVLKRLTDGELKNHSSYRGILYDEFGFGPESYRIGMDCGFLELHNAIYIREELDEELKRRENSK